MELHVCQSFFLSLFNFLLNSSLRSFYFLYVSLPGKHRHLFIILWLLRIWIGAVIEWNIFSVSGFEARANYHLYFSCGVEKLSCAWHRVAWPLP